MGIMKAQTQNAPPLQYKKSEKAQTVFLAGCTVIGCLTGLIVPAFAGSMWGRLVSELKTEGAELYKVGIAIVSSFAAVALIFAFIMRMQYSPQKAQVATAWIKNIIIGYFLILSMGAFFSIVTGIGNGGGGGGSSSSKAWDTTKDVIDTTITGEKEQEGPTKENSPEIQKYVDAAMNDFVQMLEESGVQLDGKGKKNAIDQMQAAIKAAYNTYEPDAAYEKSQNAMKQYIENLKAAASSGG